LASEAIDRLVADLDDLGHGGSGTAFPLLAVSVRGRFTRKEGFV
jgi:hypothetical protein